MDDGAAADFQLRRERRRIRREQQRAANPIRAEKMRLALAEANVVDAPTPVAPSGLRVGCSGWFYWHWRDLFYPASLPTSQWFPRYQRAFDTVELNAPFYSWPTVATVRSWVRQVTRKNFAYSVKVNELITHEKKFVRTRRLVETFEAIADLMGARLGCFLFQLPPSFHYTPARLRRILSQLSSRSRNVVEFRHKSWWTPGVFKAFRDKGVTFCACSAPRLPDDFVETSDYAYIRFHGKSRWYRHDYSNEELGLWARQIRAAKAKHIWIYFNNDREGFAIKNARTLLALLKRPA